MIALPKATSQGSNGAGPGGAFMAFNSHVGRNRSNPQSSQSTAAAQNSFFMNDPHQHLRQPSSDARGQR